MTGSLLQISISKKQKSSNITRQVDYFYKDSQLKCGESMHIIGAQTMNKSSSFYSEAYYEKARKDANFKKPIYRQRNKEMYDQKNELDILKYYKNKTGKCEMIRYYELIVEQFFILKDKNIKGSDQYNETANEFFKNVNEKIRYFHVHLMCDNYETREDRQNQAKKEEDKNDLDRQTNIDPQQKDQTIIACDQMRKLDTCNRCPIFIEEYEHNYAKTANLITKQSSYWDKLNGCQKLAKLRRHVQQNLKVLKYEFETKCEFAVQNKFAKRPKKYGN